VREPASVRFPSGDGSCSGDLYLPEGSSPVPLVVMAHGIGAERAFGLDRYARRFVDRGLGVLTFDYRHFGDSTGEPRYLVVPRRQRQDYRGALAFVRELERVDPRRLGLWGTSFSGGHVLSVAADRPPGVQAVVSQVPFVSGIASTLAFPLRLQFPAVAMAMADQVSAVVGGPRIEVPVVQPRGLALLPGAEAHRDYMAMVPEDSQWPGRLPARVFTAVLTYRPLSACHRVKAPTLLVGAAEDTICPMGATRKAARRIPRAQLEELPMGHFGAYFDPWFEDVARMEADFLEHHLLRAGAGRG
jgi:uncharacterized protein